jgi:O-acetylhomoserine/O-acetylserine sulfhydrylase-like pyridoxal-dependent enzyme
MSSNPQWSFETRQIHVGQTPDAETGARALPIYQTTSFVFPSAESAANRFALAELAPIYTRIGNPVVQSVDASGIVTTQIAVGGVVEYNLSPSVMHSFENAIKGKKQQDASSYLMHQPGIDATTVIVHVSYGDTLPTNINQIHIVPLNPTNIPNVQLPTT